MYIPFLLAIKMHFWDQKTFKKPRCVIIVHNKHQRNLINPGLPSIMKPNAISNIHIPFEFIRFLIFYLNEDCSLIIALIFKCFGLWSQQTVAASKWQ